ncbi:MAG TPA: amidohydrolase family protein [Candidatus Acidoferrales bacterium]|nr:amidohydrolase family protein [Candidatus Acidoferrales bacterium]
MSTNVTLVRAGHVLTMGPLGDISGGAVAIRDELITDVGPFAELNRKYPGSPVVGDDYGIVIPGLVNAHTHMSEALIPGMAENLTIWIWARRLLMPVIPHLTREMARVGALFRGGEAVRSWVTTVNDMFCHANLAEFASLGSVDGLEEIGLRGVVSFGAEDIAWGASASLPVARIVEEHHALAEHCAGSRRIGFRVGIGTILGQSDALLEVSSDLARSVKKGIHTHLAEVRDEKTAAQIRWGKSTVLHANEIGILGADCIAGHGVWVSPEEIEMIATKKAAIIYNPTANMILGSGVCPLGELAAHGILMGIGTDGMASNDSHNMIEVLKLGSLLQKVHRQSPEAADARLMLKMSTIDGARVLGLGNVTGSLEAGKRADIVRFDGNSFGVAVVHDPYQQIVYGAGPESVADVWVDGRRLLADGQFVSFDLPSNVPKVRELARDLARAGNMSELSCLAR